MAYPMNFPQNQKKGCSTQGKSFVAEGMMQYWCKNTFDEMQ